MTLLWIALALGLASTIMGHVSSAAHRESFISNLRRGFIYAASHAIFTTLIFTALFYVVLLIGSWIF